MPTNDEILDAQFAEFNQANPHVYWTLLRLAREARARGRTKVGIKMLYEVCRWEMTLQTSGDEEYKLNNNFTSRYARLLMQHNPELAGFFEIRAMASERRGGR